MPRLSNVKSVQALREHMVFANNSNNLIGAVRFRGWGELPEEWQDYSSDVEYWIYSYSTPIAWVEVGGAIQMPPVTYSLNTTLHQQMVAIAFDLQPVPEYVPVSHRPNG